MVVLPPQIKTQLTATLPNCASTPFSSPRPTPRRIINIKIPQNTPNAVRIVRSLWRLSESNISCHLSRSNICDHSIIEPDGPVRHGRNVGFVRDDDDCLALLVDFPEDLYDFARPLGVERPCRLVGEDQFW